MTNEEMYFIVDSIRQLAMNHKEWKQDYRYQLSTNEFIHNSFPPIENNIAKNWFETDLC